MKTLGNVLFFLLTMVTMMACDETIEPKDSPSDLLMGTWINPTPVDTFWQYERAAQLNNGAYGFSFKSNDQFIERKNEGWCGTPPITLVNFEGTWSKKDSLITINVDYWGGKADYQWKIISLDDHHLVIYKVNETYGYNE